ncbi:MAG: anti-sigma factor antagonist [Candidatus Krumholzibacteria bacterium]|nr:anti-sigma factor antagonist [Candidatus Krumholzibacteria bacterium]
MRGWIRIDRVDFTRGAVSLSVDSRGHDAALEHLDELLEQCRSRGLTRIAVAFAERERSERALLDYLLARHGAVVERRRPARRPRGADAWSSTARVSGEAATVEYSLRLDNLATALDRTTTAAILIGCASDLDQTTRSHLRLAMYELAVNSVEHGEFQNDAPEIRIAVRVSRARAWLYYMDNGALFVTGKHMHMDIADKIAQRDKRGLGLYILNKLANTIEYKRLQDWNVTTLVFEAKEERTTQSYRRPAMEGIAIETQPCNLPGTVIVKPAGSIDSATTAILEAHFDALIAQNTRRIVIDFAQVDFISSAGVGILLGTVSLLRSEGGDLVFTNLPGHIEEVFDIINLKSFFRTIDSIDELEAVEQKK